MFFLHPALVDSASPLKVTGDEVPRDLWDSSGLVSSVGSGEGDQLDMVDDLEKMNVVRLGQ